MSMTDHEEETIESIVETLKGIMDIMANHAVMLAAVMRALDNAKIEVPGFTHPHKPVN